jgi:hypothetical protein
MTSAFTWNDLKKGLDKADHWLDKQSDKIVDDINHPDHLNADIEKGLKKLNHEINDKKHHGFIGENFDKFRDLVKDTAKDIEEDKKKKDHEEKETQKPVQPFGPPPPRHAHCSIMAEFDHPCDELW